jgi:hypothetical protein
VIERIFGVVKRRFKVLVVAQEYSLDIQSQLISALSVLHNFILINDPDDIPEDIKITRDDCDNQHSRDQGTVSNAEQNRAAQCRDKIAHNMWCDFEHGVRQRRRG